MADSWFTLDVADQTAVLRTAATTLGKQSTVLEKDIWLCWVLQVIFAMPDAHPMAFKGGTSLSKVYGIIDRFSEDVESPLITDISRMILILLRMGLVKAKFGNSATVSRRMSRIMQTTP